jgi:hypothetical protein
MHRQAGILYMMDELAGMGRPGCTLELPIGLLNSERRGVMPRDAPVLQAISMPGAVQPTGFIDA